MIAKAAKKTIHIQEKQKEEKRQGVKEAPP